MSLRSFSFCEEPDVMAVIDSMAFVIDACLDVSLG